jgi:hypothetical protein
MAQARRPPCLLSIAAHEERERRDRHGWIRCGLRVDF